MGISLTGLTPATTYDALIKVGDNGPIDGTLKVLSDGLGTNLPMEASTTGVNFTGNLTQSGTALQPVLVSGTNIKTINSTSILGSGNIAVVTSPSGVSGAIQFSNGSAFASDAANLFWDDTNNRLGVGTNSPSGKAQIITDDATSPFAYSSQLTQLAGSALQGLLVGYSSTNGSFISSVFPGNSFLNMTYTAGEHRFSNAGTIGMTIHTNGNTTIGNGTTSLSARLGIKGSGSTSATTSLLVQNSAGTQSLKIADDLGFQIGALAAAGAGQSIRTDNGGGGVNGGINTNFNNGATWIDDTNTRAMHIAYNGGVLFPNTTRYPITIGSATKAVASAQLEMVSTTQGFLPPRGTNTQMNAISSPATGLVFYDTTNNKLCVYNATSWIPLH
jgi:hypothetical protein